MREVVSGMMRSESAILKKTTAIYLRGVYDRTIQIMDTIETFRDIPGHDGGILIQCQQQNQRNHESLNYYWNYFYPLTFITGVYGEL